MAVTSFRLVLSAWWRYFWRYSAFLFILLLLNGWIINSLAAKIPAFALYALFAGLFSNILASFLMLFCVLGRKLPSSEYVLMPGSSSEATLLGKIFVCMKYVFLFLVFLIAFSFILGAFMPYIFKAAGVDPVKSLDYIKYYAYAAYAPASFISFYILMIQLPFTKKSMHMQLKSL